MAYETKPGSGTLFQNDQRGNDRAPNWRGELLLESGETLKIAGWTKSGRKGDFISLSVDKPRDDSNRGGGSSSSRGREDSFSGGRGAVEDTEVPF